MRKIHIITEYVPLFAGMLMLLSSCEHKDLCFDHDPHAPKSEVRIEAEYEKEWQYTYEGSTDWKNFPTWQESFGMEYDALRPGIPDGLRMQVYNADDSDEIVNIAPRGRSCICGRGNTPCCSTTTTRNTSCSTRCSRSLRQRPPHEPVPVPLISVILIWTRKTRTR